MSDLYHYVHPKNKTWCPMISKECYEIIKENADAFNSAIIYDRDYQYTYFGFKVISPMTSFGSPIKHLHNKIDSGTIIFAENKRSGGGEASTSADESGCRHS